MADQIKCQEEIISDASAIGLSHLSGGGGETCDGPSNAIGGGAPNDSLPSDVGSSPPSTNGPSKSPTQQQEPQHLSVHKASVSSSRDTSQKGEVGYDLNYEPAGSGEPLSLPGPNELFFGFSDRSSGLSYKDREEKVRQLRERQKIERQQKLEELKEQAAAAQRFREQQEAARRQRLDDMKSKDHERRNQVEERKRLIQQAEQDRREAVLKKSAEREHRLELKRRQERSNVVFAFGSSTPRMLDPKENIQNYFGSRRATSTTNVNLSESASSVRRVSEAQENDFSRKRATSAHSLNRKPEGEDSAMQRPLAPLPPPTAARRRTDLLPAFTSLRDSAVTSRGSPRHRSPGIRSGTVTPGSSSRPTSALSQASGGSQVLLRTRTSPKKPRPLSIAGSTLSSADKPRENATASASPASPNRESRSVDRKSSTGSITPKPSRAKSAGSDRSAPPTPAKTPRGPTPKRTPAQVKAENAAKKASERIKATPKLRPTTKSTPVQSPSVESKPMPSSEKQISPDETESKDEDKPLHIESEEQLSVAFDSMPPDNLDSQVDAKVESEVVHEISLKIESEVSHEIKESASVVEEIKESPSVVEEIKEITPVIEEIRESTPVIEEIKESTPVIEEIKESTPVIEEIKESTPAIEELVATKVISEDQTVKETKTETEEAKTQGQAQTEQKSVTGYASEEEYKAALAEKRRQAREAKEREQELERQRKLEEEEKERREEEEYLRLMEEQRKAEEDRLQKAILEAQRQREEEARKKEEEEKQRIEAEKIEQQKKLEAEEKMKKEEEERQMRKSRVAAIMSRTRGRGAGSTPSKTEPKTPSDENKGLNDSIMTESFINDLSSSMTDSMIVQAIESHQSKMSTSQEDEQPENVILAADSSPQPPDPSIQPPETSSQGLPDTVSQLHTDTSKQIINIEESNSQFVQSHTETKIMRTSDFETITKVAVSNVNTTVDISKQEDNLESLISGITSINLLETQINGNAPVPMETTPTTQTVDLLGSFTGVNGITHNGVHSDRFQPGDRQDNEFGSLDPINSTNIILPSTETSFEQIIDLNQAKITNEDAVNSNPPVPIIAFEDNLNKKSQQTQETSINVPDLLL